MHLFLGLLGIYALYVCVLVLEYFEERSEARKTGTDHRAESTTIAMALAGSSKCADINDDRGHNLLKILSYLIPFDDKEWNDSNFGGKIILCITVKLILNLVLSAAQMNIFCSI